MLTLNQIAALSFLLGFGFLMLCFGICLGLRAHIRKMKGPRRND